MVQSYAEGGWRADRAVLEALAAVTTPQDRDAVSAVIAHVYKPWLRDAAELFQARVAAEPVPGQAISRLADVPAGTCLLFADGLRFDVGQMLREQLEGKVGAVALGHHLAALPTVTPTAKPAVSPVAGKITGTTAGEDFRPRLAASGKDLTPDQFRRLLEDAGYQVLSAHDTGDPQGRAWTEFGNIDQTGHNEGIGLAHRIPELVRHLVQRIEGLIAAGWQEVRVVTDHGWLLMPTGLPKADLPKYLTETRWRRCAVVKGSATVDLPCFEWFWSEPVRIASPPGIDCFLAGEDYNHGGLSLQECVVPRISVRGAAQPASSASIGGVKWSGLRCRVKVTGTATGCQIDLRDKAAAPETSIAEPKPVKDGNASVVVKAEHDSREGSAAILVLLDASGNVIDRMAVTVGE